MAYARPCAVKGAGCWILLGGGMLWSDVAVHDGSERKDYEGDVFGYWGCAMAAEGARGHTETHIWARQLVNVFAHARRTRRNNGPPGGQSTRSETGD